MSPPHKRQRTDTDDFVDGFKVSTRTHYSDTPQRAPFKLFLRSRDRDGATNVTTDPGSCTYSNIRQIDRVIGVRIKSFNVPATMYNITSGAEPRWGNTHNTFTIRITSTGPVSSTLTVTVPPAQYTINTFITALNTALASAISGAALGGTIVLTAAYSTTSLKITITGSGADFISIVRYGAAFNTMVALALGAQTINAAAVITTDVNATSVTFPNVAQLTTPTWLFVRIGDFPKNEFGDNSGRINNLGPQFAIPLTSNNASLVYNDDDVFRVKKAMLFNGQKTFENLSVQFYSSAGDLIVFNGGDYELVLEFIFCLCCLKE